MHNNQLMQLPPPNPAAGSSPSGSRYRDARTRRFAWWYDHVIDWMLCNPGATYKDIGLAFHRSPGTVSMILNSDLFRARYAQRKADYNRRLGEALIDRTARLAQKTLDLALERFDDNPEKLTTGMLIDSADKLLSRLGYGGSPDRSQNVQVNVAQVTAPQAQVPLEVLEAARAKMRLLEHQKVEDSRRPTGEPVSEPGGDHLSLSVLSGGNE